MGVFSVLQEALRPNKYIDILRTLHNSPNIRFFSVPSALTHRETTHHVLTSVRFRAELCMATVDEVVVVQSATVTVKCCKLSRVFVNPLRAIPSALLKDCGYV